MATERFGLSFEATTTGEERLARLEAAVNRAVGAFERTAKKSSESTKKIAEDSRRDFEAFADNVEKFIQNPLEGASNIVGGFLRSIGPVGVGVSAVGASFALGLKSIRDWTVALGDSAEAQLNTSIRTGLTVAEVKQFTLAAQFAGVGADGFEMAMRTLSQVMSDNTEEGRRGKEALKELGVAIYESDGQLKSAGKLWLELSDAISRIEDPFKRAHAAQLIFGRAGKELLPVLVELRSNVEKFRALGFGMTEERARELDNLADKVKEVEEIWAKLARSSKVNLVLSLKPVIEWTARTSENFAVLSRLAGKSGLDPVNDLAFRFGQAVVSSSAGIDLAGSGDGEFGEFSRGATVTRNVGSTQARALARQAARGSGASGIEAMRSQMKSLGAEIDTSRAKLEQFANTPNIAKNAVDQEIAHLRSLEKQYNTLEVSIRGAEEAEKRRQERERAGRLEISYGADGDILTVGGKPVNVPRALTARRPSLLRQGEQILPQGIVRQSETRGFANVIGGAGELVIRESDIAAANSARARAEAEQARARGEAIIARGSQERSRELDQLRLEASLAERKAELTGDELTAASRVAAVRVDAALREFQITGDIFKLEDEMYRISEERAIRILELERQRKEELRSMAGSIFDSLTASGSGGIRQFLSGYVRGLTRTIFQNTFTEFFSSAQGKLSLPGQVDKQGNLTTLGKILKGTPFGVDPLKLATDQNTLATTQNTAAIVGLSASVQAIGAVGGVSGVSSGVSGVAEGLSAKSGKIGNWTKALGIGGAALGGTLGAISGIRQGGAQGATQASGSIIGATGSILSIAGLSGPLAPILMGVGLGLGFISSLFGDPKERRRRELEDEIGRRRFEEQSGTVYDVDALGRRYDYDRTGEMRPIVVQISAIDAKSFIDRSEDIGAAVRRSLQTYPPLVEEMRASLVPG